MTKTVLDATGNNILVRIKLESGDSLTCVEYIIMAISDSQKVDLLWKKVGFGKAKTDTNSPQRRHRTNLTASNFIIKDADIWNQSGSIPGVMPTANSVA